MSTRCLITKQTEKGKYKTIYCHFDGYISGVGAVLDANYDTKEKVDGLLSLGDISSLCETLAETREKAYDPKAYPARHYNEEDLENPDLGVGFVYVYVAAGLWRVYLVNSQTWGYLPDLLKAQGIESKFASRWDAALKAAKDGDAYEQMKEAEKEGSLVDLLFNAFDILSDEDYEPLKQRWSEVWASHCFYKKEK